MFSGAYLVLLIVYLPLIVYVSLDVYFSQTVQSGPQDQKSVTFLHSVISLNQLLQNSKITAYVFLTFRKHVKIFLSQNILRNV